MPKAKKKKNFIWIYVVAASLAVLLVGVVGWLILGLLDFDKDKVPPNIQTITLVKPPPPPEVEEPPPEQKVDEPVEVLEPEEAQEEMSDEPEAAGEELGLDAEGTAGSDSFGLVGKKGGRALIGGGGNASLLRKYSWYTSIIQKEIREKVKRELDEAGGMPDGKLQALVKIVLDSAGNVVDFSIVGSSGNPRMDTAVENTLALFRVAEPPPPGMPMAMTIKITSQG